MIYRGHKKYSSKLSVLKTECKYFIKYIFLCKLFLIKFQEDGDFSLSCLNTNDYTF